MTDSVIRHRFPVLLDYPHAQRDRVFTELLGKLVALQGKAGPQLTTKLLSDPTVALLNAWAALADVIGFYQERIAAESYLTTATEPESVLALASLLGYRPRPGLAATCWLAYTLVTDPTDTAVLIPKHQVVQSVPLTGELPQTFETSEDFVARPSWNTLPLKTSRPLEIEKDDAAKPYQTPDKLLIATANSRLEPNTVVLITPSREITKRLITRVAKIDADVVTNTTTATLQQPQPSDNQFLAQHGHLGEKEDGEDEDGEKEDSADLRARIGNLAKKLNRPPSAPPSSETAIDRNPDQMIHPKVRAATDELSDMTTKLLVAVRPDLGKDLYRALATSTMGERQVRTVDALRITTAPFGVQMPPRPRFGPGGEVLQPEEWPIGDTQTLTVTLGLAGAPAPALADRAARQPRTLTVRIDSPAEKSTVTLSSTRLEADVAGGHLKASADTLGTLTFENGGNAALDKMVIEVDHLSITATVSDSKRLAATLRPTAVPTSGSFLASASASAAGVSINAQLVGSDATGPWTQGVIEVVSALPVVDRDVLELNERRDEIVPGSYVMIDNALAPKTSTGEVVTLRPKIAENPEPIYPLVAKVIGASPLAVNRYGMSLTVTRLKLDSNWIRKDARLLSDLRPLVVYANSDPLDLQPTPVDTPVKGSADKGSADKGSTVDNHALGADQLDIEGLHPGIDIGRRLIVTGTRADLPDGTVTATEMVMVSGIKQLSRPGEKPYTRILLAKRLGYTYRPDSVTLYGNVVPAQQGITVTEALTATGDSDHPMFTLSQKPVLADAVGTELGFASTLKVLVDGRTWTRVSRFDERTPPACYLTGTDGNGQTTITLGQPLPNPNSTVTATYRPGEGGAGNVRAGQLTQLLTRPLAVAAVTNPLPASGGGDADGPDAVRLNAPRGLKALGRVVSVDDAADIALTWAGIGKSKAALARDRQRLTVTVAGLAPVPLVEDSQLITALRAALIAAGDVTLQIDVRPARVSLIVLVATIERDPDISWDTVEPAVRAGLLDAYSYDHRDIDEEVIRSDILAVIHRVDGVRSCSIKTIGTVPYELGKKSNLPQFRPFRHNKARNPVSGVSYFSDTVPETLILQEASR